MCLHRACRECPGIRELTGLDLFADYQELVSRILGKFPGFEGSQRFFMRTNRIRGFGVFHVITAKLFRIFAPRKKGELTLRIIITITYGLGGGAKISIRVI